MIKKGKRWKERLVKKFTKEKAKYLEKDNKKEIFNKINKPNLAQKRYRKKSNKNLQSKL